MSYTLAGFEEVGLYFVTTMFLVRLIAWSSMVSYKLGLIKAYDLCYSLITMETNKKQFTRILGNNTRARFSQRHICLPKEYTYDLNDLLVFIIVSNVDIIHRFLPM